jgi:hypothetical protein
MRTTKEIKELIDKDESQNVEFKSKFEADKVGEAICALANDWPQTGQGILILGVDNKNKKQMVCGIQDDRDKIQREVSDICRSSLSTEIAPVIYFLEVEKPILIVEIPPSQILPIRYKNHCYIRVGTTTRIANFYEELALYKKTKTKSSVHVIEDKLPSRDQPISFTGRDRELNDLWDWFKDKKSNRCILAGDGGKGKTAIAYEFAQRITEASPEPYEFVLWASAKRRQFVTGQTVPISDPDFKDLPSLLDRILIDIGFEEDVRLSTDEKEQKVIEWLTNFPALVIIDDLDSLDWSTDIATMEFVTYSLPQTKSKVLITTRRQIPSIMPILVDGFNEGDGIKFIDSRIRLAGMKTDILEIAEKKKALEVADSSPLYLEDLIRFFVVTSDFDETIKQWVSRGGNGARSYALKREFELLSEDAKKVLLAFSVLDQPATSAEAKALTNITWEKWNSGVDELQRLFLISRPGIIEGLPRFSLNSNTKSLVLSIMEGNPQILVYKQNLRNISGQSYRDIEKRKSVGSVIRQASAYVRANDSPTAEKILTSS